MKIIIEHRHTKREINGPFAFCCNREDLETLKEIIDEKLETDHSYGWLSVNEFKEVNKKGFAIYRHQGNIPNTKPKEWD